MFEKFAGVWLLSWVGLMVILYAVTRIGIYEYRLRKHKQGHDDADYNCRFWWGDRAASIGARCRICNPDGRNVLGNKTSL